MQRFAKQGHVTKPLGITRLGIMLRFEMHKPRVGQCDQRSPNQSPKPPIWEKQQPTTNPNTKVMINITKSKIEIKIQLTSTILARLACESPLSPRREKET